MTASDLSPDDFAAFFTTVHGVTPFPWQDRLLRQVAEQGEWPAVLDLPTGTGKTAALDVAVFHIALEAKKEGRRAPVRIAFVVDRRLIVDDAYSRARKLQAALAEPKSDVVKRVAAALRSLAGAGAPPLLARRLRGGLPREDDWARTPCQPTILCSTVDQVGSRLLFRGYGVSNSMKPVHAGLLGSDCLILLDEAHLSRPFRQTLDAVSQLRRPRKRTGSEPNPAASRPAPFQFALLTATPGEERNVRKVSRKSGREAEPEPDAHFALEQEDREHPILRPRLEAAKPARLLEFRGKPGQSIDEQRVAAFEEEVAAALEHLAKCGLETQPVLGVVVNRVLRARWVFGRLVEAYGPTEEGGPPRADVLLVIGPAREVDRETLATELDLIKTGQGQERRQLARPRIVVATQTIEAGVDIDFDALITEIAPLDALKQRFGRLNRAGRPFVAYAAIVAHREDVRPGKDGDPVYGQAAANTWAALQKLAQGRADGSTVDFGASASDNAPWIGKIPADQIEADGLLSSKPDAPVLMPAYVDLWSQTSPVPSADPEISLFLHGPDRSPASAQIVWRADLAEADLIDAETDSDARQRLLQLLTAMPPRTGETIDISLSAARRWLRQEDGADFADVPQSDGQEDPVRARGRPAFRWAGPDSERTEIIPAARLRPNDLIVVPAGYGGCDQFGWNPGAKESVRDVADAAAKPFATRRYALRLTPDLIRAAAPNGEDDEATAERAQASDFADNILNIIADWRGRPGRKRESDLVGAMLDANPPGRIAAALDLLRSARRRQLQALFPYGEDEGRPRGVVLLAPKGIRIARSTTEDTAESTPATEDDWQGSLSGDAQTLAEHSQQVQELAKSFAERTGLNDTMASDVALAAYLHDAGKADPRFQAMLYGGDWFAVDESRILAKSIPGVGPDAVQTAGLPSRWRHEALSVRIAREHALFREANDKELMLWLIGVHHGYGRPLFPHADDAPPTELPDVLGGLKAAPEPGPQSLAFSFDGSDWPQIFDRLKRRYGVWELARMEAIVRLADHRASEAAAGRGREDAA